MAKGLLTYPWWRHQAQALQWSLGWEQGGKTRGHVHGLGLGHSGTDRDVRSSCHCKKLLALISRGRVTAGFETGSGGDGWKSSFLRGKKWVFPWAVLFHWAGRWAWDAGQCWQDHAARGGEDPPPKHFQPQFSSLYFSQKKKDPECGSHGPWERGRMFKTFPHPSGLGEGWTFSG